MSDEQMIAVIRTALPTIIAADQNDILGKLSAKVNAHKADISTPKGRDEIRSLAQEIASSKVTLIKLGKSLTEGWRKQTKAVNDECNVIEERMDALKVQVRQPLTDFENAEKARIAAHEAALEALDQATYVEPGSSSQDIRKTIEAFECQPSRNWQEFGQRAQKLVDDGRKHLSDCLKSAEQREAEAIELARLRAEDAERKRIEAIQAQKERDERIAAEAAEKARIEAETKAKREADAVAQAAEMQARQMREAAAQAHARAEKAEADRTAAEQRAVRQAAEAAEKAKREQDAAVEAERRRAAAVEAAAKAEAERRAANVAHQKKINREARDAIEKIVAYGIEAMRSPGEKPVEIAQAIVIALAKGQIPHCSLEY